MEMSRAEQILKELGLELPPAPQPASFHDRARSAGNLVFLSGQGATREGKPVMTGHVGGELTLEQGYRAAQICALNALAALKQEIGDLDRVRRVVKVLGWVNSAPGFEQQPLVINGFSELMVKAFGECGRHARSAIAAPELPSGTPVEVEMIVEVEA